MRIRYQPHDHFRCDTGQINGLASLHANFWHSWRILGLSLCAFSTALAGHCATMAVRDATATTKNTGADSPSKASTASASYSYDDSSSAHASSAHSSSATRTDSARTTTSSAGAKAATSNIGNIGNTGNTGHTGKTAAKRTAGKGAGRKTVRERGPVAPTAQRISEIQSALSSQGSFQGDPTGRWDDATIDAMKQFQATHGLNPSGKLDALSLQKLGLGSDTAGRGAPYVPAVPPQASDMPSPVAPSSSDVDSENP